MTIEEMRDVMRQVECGEYSFHIIEDGKGAYLQASYPEPDIITTQLATQNTRKWRLSQWMTKSELVQTALKCVLTSVEHRAREHFLYKGRRVYGPHLDVEALWEIAKKLDYRKTN